MPLLSDAQHAQIRVGVVDRIAFGDDYQLQAKNPAGVDSRNNPIFADPEWVTIEAGSGKLRVTNLHPQERLIADQLGWSVAYAFALPASSLAQPEHRIVIDDFGRVLHIGGVIRGGRNRKRCIAVCEERSH